MMDCTVKELREEMQRQGRCLVLDVREYPEFANGRLPGSLLIPLSEISRRADELDGRQTIYLVCQTGRRSAAARRKLIALGFSQVRNVTGGFLAWQAAGFEVERDRRLPWALERQVRLVAGSLVLTGVLLSLFIAHQLIWLAGFVGAGLIFAALTDTCAMGTMLAKMPWNRAAQSESCGVEERFTKE